MCNSKAFMPTIGIKSEIWTLSRWHQRLVGQSVSVQHFGAQPGLTQKTCEVCASVMLREPTQHSSWIKVVIIGIDQR